MSHGSCKNCGVSFDGEDIYQFFLNQNNSLAKGCAYPTTVEEVLKNAKQYPDQYNPLPENLSSMSQNELDAWNYARSYGWTFENPKTFGVYITGIETDGYDGVSFWHCSKCKYTWKRFEWSDIEKLKKEEWAKDYKFEVDNVNMESE